MYSTTTQKAALVILNKMHVISLVLQVNSFPEQLFMSTKYKKLAST